MTFQTVLISVCTSAAITLLVEFLAKPYADARKDRILEKHRALRTARSATGRIATKAAALSTRFSDTSRENQRILNEEYNVRRLEIYGEARKIEDIVMDYGLEMPSYERLLLSKYSSLVAGLSKSDKLRADAGQQIFAVTAPVVDYYFVRSWHRIGRRRRLLKWMKDVGWDSDWGGSREESEGAS